MGYRALSFLLLIGTVSSSSDYYGPEFDNPPEIELMDGPTLKLRTPGVNIESVRSVLDRLPKWISDELSSIQVAESTHLSEGFARLIGSKEGVQVEANSPVDALYAIHAYIREFCGTMITWEGMNVKKNGECTRPENFERTFNSPKLRYFGNPVTYSYSFPWWGWNEWERFIDWLALSGFNAVLAPVGQEAIWADIWTELGVSNKGLDEFFSGPAFLAWHRMGAVQGLGGPMSAEYLESQLELNKNIVNRLVQLGIVPVLPTFAGFVPKEFERKHENLRYIHNTCWNRLNSTYSCTSTLHPDEEEFKEIAKLFIENQMSVYGDVTNAYSADPFLESPPKHLTERDVTSMSSSIYEGCRMGNFRCVWFMQSWTFSYDGWKKNDVKAFLGQVPKGKMIILDMQAERRPLHKEFDDFHGHYFVWCLLHNFGGNTQMRGNLGRMHEDYRTDLASSTGMIGFGLTMEGINQNYVVYQYMIDLAWTDKELDPHEWITGYAAARYGTRSTLQDRAWKTLLATFYTQVNYEYDPTGILENPEFSEQESRREIFLYFRPKFSQRIRYWFPLQMIEKIGNGFVMLNRTIGSHELFQQDFADVMREVLQNKLSMRLQYVNNGYSLQTPSIMKQGCAEVEELFEKLDKNEVRNLSDWILMAREAATSDAEADSFEKQAINQLTLWGPAGENQDYARKEWRGLIRKFYEKRWAFFCEHLQSGVRYNQKKFEELLYKEVELPFGRL